MLALRENRLHLVESKNGLYRQFVELEADPLIAESNARVLCFDVAELAKSGVELFDSINSLDEDWRALVLDGVASYCANYEKRIERLYRQWLQTSQQLLAVCAAARSECERNPTAQTGFARLEQAIREVQGLLTDDKDFFNSERLADLRDQAIDDAQAGNTEEIIIP